MIKISVKEYSLENREWPTISNSKTIVVYEQRSAKHENNIKFKNKKHVECSEQTGKPCGDFSHQQFFRWSKLNFSWGFLLSSRRIYTTWIIRINFKQYFTVIFQVTWFRFVHLLSKNLKLISQASSRLRGRNLETKTNQIFFVHTAPEEFKYTKIQCYWICLCGTDSVRQITSRQIERTFNIKITRSRLVISCGLLCR